MQFGDAPDSEDHLDAWLGKTQRGRNLMLEEAFTQGLRMGDWKYISPLPGTTPDWLKNKQIESGLSNKSQLYNLKNDIAERDNVALKNPQILQAMEMKLDSIDKAN